MMVLNKRTFLTGVTAAFAAVVAATHFVHFASGADGPVTHEVVITKFKFVPARLSAKPGDVIVWTNNDVAPHTATALDKAWDTGTIKSGQSKSVSVSQAMAGAYLCRFHPQMKADLAINAGS